MSENKKLSSLKKDEMPTSAVKGGGFNRKHNVLASEEVKTSSSAGKAKGSTLSHNIGADDAMGNSGDDNYYPPKH